GQHDGEPPDGREVRVERLFVDLRPLQRCVHDFRSLLGLGDLTLGACSSPSPLAPLPSPLVGEGGSEQSEEPGEGFCFKKRRPLTRLAHSVRSPPSPARGEGGTAFASRPQQIATTPPPPCVPRRHAPS